MNEQIGKMMITDPERLKDFAPSKRVWQGIPSFERTEKGRCFATYYSGETGEVNGNYCVLAVSDDGENWRDPLLVTYAGKDKRCYDAALWIDPTGRLWFVWSVMPDLSVYAAVCDDPDADEIVFGEERRIGEGVMLNKPIALSSGEWLFPIAVWDVGIMDPFGSNKPHCKRLAYAVRTVDEGKTFTRIGGVAAKKRCFDEHMILELRGGILAMFVRTFYGIGVSYSYDGGFTWTENRDTGILSPNSRFFVRRLSSGNVLLVTNDSKKREKLTAFVSDDDCRTWKGGLVLDKRDPVSYPDGAERDGVIYIAYDFERGGYGRTLEAAMKQAREILYARFTEADVLAGRNVSGKCEFRKIISKLGEYDGRKNPFNEKIYFTDDEYVDYLMTLDGSDAVLKKLYADGVTCYTFPDEDERERTSELIEKFGNETDENKKRGILLSLIGIFRSKRATAMGDEEKFIGEIIDYIDGHSSEEITLERLSRVFGLSRYYLCHVFKRRTNVSVTRFIMQRRIYKAKKMLTGTDRSVTDVGFDCGFTDSAYFIRQFRSSEGISPGAYRKKMRGNK